MKPIWWLAIGVVVSNAISIPVSRELALRLPVERQVAIIDIKKITEPFKSLDMTDPRVETVFQEKIEEYKKYAKKMADQGMIVLDTTGVLAAPDDAYIGAINESAKK